MELKTVSFKQKLSVYFYRKIAAKGYLPTTLFTPFDWRPVTYLFKFVDSNDECLFENFKNGAAFTGNNKKIIKIPFYYSVLSVW